MLSSYLSFLAGRPGQNFYIKDLLTATWIIPQTETLISEVEIPLPVPIEIPLPKLSGLALQVSLNPVKVKKYDFIMPRGKEWIIHKERELYIFIPWVDHEEIRKNMMLQVKAVSGRRWDPETKRWRFPIRYALQVANCMDRFFPELAVAIRNHPAIDEFQRWERERWDCGGAVSLRELDAATGWLEDDLKVALPRRLELYEFQKVGVFFFSKCWGKALLADEMGLGKTVQCLAYYAWDPMKTLIVSPAGYKFGWVKEVRKWVPRAKVAVIATSRMTHKDILKLEKEGVIVLSNKGQWPEFDILVTNYEQIRATWNSDLAVVELQPQAQKIKDENFKMIFIDECQKLADWNTQQTRGVVAIGETCERRIGISGTPVRNRPEQFYTILHLLNSTDFPTWKEYVTEFCDARTETIYVRGGDTKEVLKTDGSSNWQRLHWKLKTMMLRRERSQVGQDLPEKVRQVVELDLNLTRYHKYVKQLPKDIGAISALRIETAQLKVPFCCEMAEQVVDSDGAVVIFYHHRKIGIQLEGHFHNKGIETGKIDGQVEAMKKQTLIDNFQAGAFPVMLVSTLSGGVGITLTKASTALFLEPEWSPADILQAEDRIARIGQEKSSVYIVHFYVPDTIDELFYDQLDGKMDIINKIIDEKVGLQYLKRRYK